MNETTYFVAPCENQNNPGVCETEAAAGVLSLARFDNELKKRLKLMTDVTWPVSRAVFVTTANCDLFI